jgi:hypothetical protein
MTKVWQRIKAILKDDAGGLGDMVMELAIIGAGSYSVFTNVRTGMSSLGTKIQTEFTNTTLP